MEEGKSSSKKRMMGDVVTARVKAQCTMQGAFPGECPVIWVS